MDKLKFKLPNSPFKNEAKFTTRFGKKCKEKGYFFHKISDMDRGIKPFDSIVMATGTPIAIEFKMNNNNSCYPYRMLKGSRPNNPGGQVKGLENFNKNSGKSLIIIYNRNKNSYKITDFSELDFNTKIYFDD